MKNLVLTILLLSVTTNFIYTQNNYHNEFWKYVDQFDTTELSSNGLFKQGNDLELEKVMKALYLSRDIDPIAWDKELYNRHQNWKKRVQKGVEDRNEKKPAIVVGKIKNRIDAKYGKNYSEIISVPYFLKVRVVKIADTIWNSKVEKNLKAKQTNLTCIVEEKLKGNKKIEVGQEVEISFLKWWRNTCEEKVEIGESYLILVTYWWQADNSVFPLTFKNFDDGFNGIYPINNEIVKISEIFFGKRDILPWSVFKNKFMSKYYITENISETK